MRVLFYKPCPHTFGFLVRFVSDSFVLPPPARALHMSPLYFDARCCMYFRVFLRVGPRSHVDLRACLRALARCGCFKILWPGAPCSMYFRVFSWVHPPWSACLCAFSLPCPPAPRVFNVCFWYLLHARSCIFVYFRVFSCIFVYFGDRCPCIFVYFCFF